MAADEAAEEEKAAEAADKEAEEAADKAAEKADDKAARQTFQDISGCFKTKQWRNNKNLSRSFQMFHKMFNTDQAYNY